MILTAAVTRQTLDNNKSKYKETGAKKCGKFWRNYPSEDGIDLVVRKACNMIIHATDIAIKTNEYYYTEDGKPHRKVPIKIYFSDTINITGKSKNYAKLDFKQFAQHCIELSDKIALTEV